MKKYFLITLAILFTTTVMGSKPFTVVLDPGHGGKDPGATRYGVHEAHINLDIALLIGDMIEKNHDDVKVVYTRKTDKTLTPSERMANANKAEGDIFVSIHVNSAYNAKRKKDVTEIHGFEVYIQTVENIERKTRTLKQKGSITSVGESGEERDLSRNQVSNSTLNAIYEIKQAQIFNLSNNLATYVRNEMKAQKRYERGVKQQSLYVTWQTTMPSILVEVGYITNPDERKFMSSKEGQTILAKGIYEGIIKYKNDFDLSKEPLQSIVIEEPAEQISNTNENNEDEVIFMWQIFTTSKPLKENDERFKNLKCSYYKDNNLYKYTYGESSSYDEVLKMQGEIKKLFRDAFIIALKNGQRVNINEFR